MHGLSSHSTHDNIEISYCLALELAYYMQEVNMNRQDDRLKYELLTTEP